MGLRIANSDDQTQNRPDSEFDPERRQHPRPRPINKACQFQANEQNGQQTTKADAAGVGIAAFHVAPPENG